MPAGGKIPHRRCASLAHQRGQALIFEPGCLTALTVASSGQASPEPSIASVRVHLGSRRSTLHVRSCKLSAEIVIRLWSAVIRWPAEIGDSEFKIGRGPGI